MNQLKIYLAGGIHGKGFDEANKWRLDVTQKLELRGHETINPLRNRLWKNAEEQGQFNPNELVDRDLMDVKRADALLVELIHDNRNYIGTAIEMGKAKDWHKPIFVVTGARTKYSPWVTWLATKVFDTFDEACEYICDVLV